jgi:hypothetical protein
LDAEIIAIFGCAVDPVAILRIQDEIVFHFAVFDDVLLGLEDILLLNVGSRGNPGFWLGEIWHVDRDGLWTCLSMRVGRRTCVLNGGKQCLRVNFAF